MVKPGGQKSSSQLVNLPDARPLPKPLVGQNMKHNDNDAVSPKVY